MRGQAFVTFPSVDLAQNALVRTYDTICPFCSQINCYVFVLLVIYLMLPLLSVLLLWLQVLLVVY